MTCKINADTSNGLKLESDTSGEIDLQIDASTKVHMASDGKVGIGTTSPDSLLHLKSTSATGAIINLETTHSGGIPIYNLKGAHSAQLRYQDENGNNQSRIDFLDGGDFNFIDATDGTSHLKINSNGNVGIGTTSPASILDVNGGSANGVKIQAANAATEYVLSATTSNGTSRLWVGGTGNVGIGTTSPDRKVVIDAGSGYPLKVNSTQDYMIGLSRSGTEQWWLKAYNNGDFAIHENGVGDQLHIDAGGKVGIGTTSPQQELDVDGVIKQKVYTVSSLPTAGSSTAGCRAFVSDSAYAFSYSYLGYTVSGGGSNFVPVYSDGSYWYIG